jgi:hypothetical protein
LSVLLLQAFIAGLPHRNNSGSSKTTLSSTVRILPITGAPSLSSYIMEHGILVDIPLPIGAPRKLIASNLHDGMRVILYNISITADPTELFSSSVYLRTTDSSSSSSTTTPSSAPTNEVWDATSVRYNELTSLVDLWHALGIRVILCQKLIHPVVRHYALSLGILPIERLSIRHINAVHTITGGTVLSSLSHNVATKDVCGKIASIEEKLIGKRKYLQMTPISNKSSGDAISTMVLCGVDEPAIDELHDTINSTLAVMTQCLTQPMMLPGGGCTEAMIAQHIRRCIDLQRHHTVADSKQSPSLSSSSSSSRTARPPSMGYHREGVLAGAEQLAISLEHLSTTHVRRSMSHPMALNMWLQLQQEEAVTPMNNETKTMTSERKHSSTSSSLTKECYGWHSLNPHQCHSVMTLTGSAAGQQLVVNDYTILDPLYIKLVFIFSSAYCYVSCFYCTVPIECSSNSS